MLKKIYILHLSLQMYYWDAEKFAVSEWKPKWCFFSVSNYLTIGRTEGRKYVKIGMFYQFAWQFCVCKFLPKAFERINFQQLEFYAEFSNTAVALLWTKHRKDVQFHCSLPHKGINEPKNKLNIALYLAWLPKEIRLMSLHCPSASSLLRTFGWLQSNLM